MKTEKLLKNISNMIKKHEDFLSDNPEIFLSIQDRLLKAIDDYDEDLEYAGGDYDAGDVNQEFSGGYEDFENDYEAQYADILDDGPDDNYGVSEPTHVESDHLDEDLFTDYPELKQESAVEEPINVTEQVKTGEDKSVKDVALQSRRKAKEWKPRDLASAFKDKPDKLKKLQTDMYNLIQEGFSEREAEMIAGASETPDFIDGNVFTAAPTAPSQKILDIIRQHSADKLAEYHFKKDQQSDPAKNPIKWANFKNAENIKNYLASYEEQLKELTDSDEYKNMSRSEKRKARQDFNDQYMAAKNDSGIDSSNFENQDFKQQAKEARENHLQEQANALMGMGASDEAVVGEASGRSVEEQSSIDKFNAELSDFMNSDEYKNLSDEEQEEAYDDFVDNLAYKYKTEESAGQMTDEAGIQMAGGSRDQEGQAQVGIERDPFQAMAQANPELVEKLKSWQYNKKRVQELSSKNPKISQRISQLGAKKPPTGGE